MVLTALHRPNNFLINRLGFGANWKTNPSYYLSKKVYNFLSQTYLSKYFRILFKSGVIYSNHVFFNEYFFSNEHLTMPVVSTREHLYKFFRLVRLKYSVRFKAKRNYLMRKYLNYLNISEFYFLRVNSLILIMLYVSIPEPLKRFNFLLNSTQKFITTKTNVPSLIKLQRIGSFLQKAYNFF